MSASTGGSASGGFRRRLVATYLDDARRVHAARAARPDGPAPPVVAGPGEPALSRDQIRDLVEPHLFYVVQVASEFSTREGRFDDLLAEGNAGLVEAAHHFDSAHGVKFLTYASWWIRKRMLEFLVREGQPVRLTRYARDRRKELRTVKEGLLSRLGREPTNEELSRESGLDVSTVIKRSDAGPVVVSLEHKLTSEGGISIKDALKASNSQSPEQIVLERGIRDLVRAELARFPDRERAIIESRFGLNGARVRTFQEIGDELGLSRERARQIERETLARLRRSLNRRIHAKPESS